MHIPSVSNTANLQNILSFDEALSKAQEPQKEYDCSKWLYVPCEYSEYRYILGTRGQKPLICIGINPSTAAPDNLDNTLKSVQRIASCNGFDSFIMFNLYPQRATNPDDMEKDCNTYLHKENLAAFEYILSSHVSSVPAVWAAWGAIIEKRQYLFECALDMVNVGKRYGATWYTAGKRSKSGHPHHPLYLPKDSVLDLFDVESYIDNCIGITV